MKIVCNQVSANSYLALLIIESTYFLSDCIERTLVSDIAIFVLKRDVKLQLTERTIAQQAAMDDRSPAINPARPTALLALLFQEYVSKR